MNPHITTLYAHLARKNLDGILVSNPSNISYLAGFKSRDAYAIISQHGNIYYTDSRYTEEVRGWLKGFTLKKIQGSVFSMLAEGCKRLGLKRIGFEERHLVFAEFQKIKEAL